jgi:hypothetical protein
LLCWFRGYIGSNVKCADMYSKIISVFKYWIQKKKIPVEVGVSNGSEVGSKVVSAVKCTLRALQ